MTTVHPIHDPQSLRKAARISLSGSVGIMAFVVLIIGNSGRPEDVAIQVVAGYVISLLYGGLGLILLGRARAIGRRDPYGSIGLAVTTAVLVTGTMLFAVSVATAGFVLLSALGVIQP